MRITNNQFLAPIRKTSDSGVEWIDVSDSDCTLEDCEKKIEASKERIGINWDKANPVVRIVKLNITEGETIKNYSR